MPVAPENAKPGLAGWFRQNMVWAIPAVIAVPAAIAALAFFFPRPHVDFEPTQTLELRFDPSNRNLVLRFAGVLDSSGGRDAIWQYSEGQLQGAGGLGIPISETDIDCDLHEKPLSGSWPLPAARGVHQVQCVVTLTIDPRDGALFERQGTKVLTLKFADQRGRWNHVRYCVELAGDMARDVFQAHGTESRRFLEALCD